MVHVSRRLRENSINFKTNSIMTHVIFHRRTNSLPIMVVHKSAIMLEQTPKPRKNPTTNLLPRLTETLRYYIHPIIIIKVLDLSFIFFEFYFFKYWCVNTIGLFFFFKGTCLYNFIGDQIANILWYIRIKWKLSKDGIIFTKT